MEICKEISQRPRWGRDWGEGPPRNWLRYKCKNWVSIDLGLGNNIRTNGYVVQVTPNNVTYVHEETMFLADPIIKSAMNTLVLHVHPYIGEVVECFSPPPRI